MMGPWLVFASLLNGATMALYSVSLWAHAGKQGTARAASRLQGWLI